MVAFPCQLTPGAVRLACARVSRAIIIRQGTLCNTLLSRRPRCITIATRLPATRLLPAHIIWTKWQLVQAARDCLGQTTRQKQRW